MMLSSRAVLSMPSELKAMPLGDNPLPTTLMRCPATRNHSQHVHNPAKRSVLSCSTAQHSTAQHSTAQHSTAWHGTAKHSKAPVMSVTVMLTEDYTMDSLDTQPHQHAVRHMSIQSLAVLSLAFMMPCDNLTTGKHMYEMLCSRTSTAHVLYIQSKVPDA